MPPKKVCATCDRYAQPALPRRIRTAYDHRQGRDVTWDDGPGSPFPTCERFNYPMTPDDGCIKGWRPKA